MTPISVYDDGPNCQFDEIFMGQIKLEKISTAAPTQKNQLDFSYLYGQFFDDEF